MLRKTSIALAFCLLSTSVAFGATPAPTIQQRVADLEQENKDLKLRIEALEKKLGITGLYGSPADPVSTAPATVIDFATLANTYQKDWTSVFGDTTIQREAKDQKIQDWVTNVFNGKTIKVTFAIMDVRSDGTIQGRLDKSSAWWSDLPISANHVNRDDAAKLKSGSRVTVIGVINYGSSRGIGGRNLPQQLSLDNATISK